MLSKKKFTFFWKIFSVGKIKQIFIFPGGFPGACAFCPLLVHIKINQEINLYNKNRSFFIIFGVKFILINIDSGKNINLGPLKFFSYLQL